MQRVRIGITGLAVVFLVVLLAAAIVGFPSEDESDTTGSASNAALSSRPTPSDPLADLGVAPGGTGSESGVSPSAAPRR